MAIRAKRKIAEGDERASSPGRAKDLSLRDALRALLEAMPRQTYEPSYVFGSTKRVKLPPLSLDRVEVRGRNVSVQWGPVRRRCRGDRVAFLTLARDLWGASVVLRCHDARDLAAERETVEYIHALRKVDEADARLVYAQHFPDQYMQRDERLAGLFGTPLYAWKHLNEAASGGALVKRALPHAAKGKLLDRVAAIRAIDVALADAWRHRHWEELNEHLRRLATALARADAAVLRECAWLLVRKIDWADARRAALTPADRKALRLPPLA